MAKILTQAALDALKPGDKRREIPDGKIGGLYFVLQVSGAASWAYRYRSGGRARKLTLGTFPALSIADARAAAKRAAADVANGRDPAGEKVAARNAAKAKAVGEAAPLDLVESVVRRFVARQKLSTRERSWRELERLLMREVVGPWRGRRLSEIKRADVISLIDVLALRAPIVGNRTLGALRALFNFAIIELELLDSSPADRVRFRTKERPRDRVLSDEELRALLAALDQIGSPHGPFLKLLTLLGVRRGELGGATWAEFDLPGATWVIPANRSKNHVEHLVPLSEAALAILTSLPRFEGKASLFGEPVLRFWSAKAKIDVLMLAALKRAAIERGEDPDEVTLKQWQTHDLRRVVATNLQRLGVRLEVVENVLGHSGGSRSGVVGTYQRHAFGPETRAALERWAGRLAEIASGEAAAENVIAFTPR